MNCLSILFVVFTFGMWLHARQREYGDSGQLKNNATMLQELGFEVGQFITRRKDKIVAKITAMDTDHVTIHVDEGPFTGLAQVSLKSFLEKKEWKPMSKDPVVPEELKNWTQFTASENVDLKVHIAKSKIFEQLSIMENQHKEVYPGLQIFVKPHRNVVAKAKFEKNQLVLVPTTMRIDVVHAGETVKEPGNHVCVGKANTGSMSFYLMPCFGMPSVKGDGRPVGFVSPYWCIRPTRDENEANVQKSGEHKPSDTNSSLKIHTIKNHKVINPGDSLIMFVPKEEKTQDLEQLVPLEPPKRRRTGKHPE